MHDANDHSYGKMVDDLGVAPQLTDTAGHPNLARWWKEISSLPAWAAVQATLKANAK
jgi:glutathione S-transferase